MRQSIRQIVLSIGLSLVFISFLFFGRQAGTYMILLTVGLITSFISYVILLFSKKSRKTKLIWTLVVLLAIAVQYVSTPFLIKTSYLIYISSNANELKEINDILIKHDGTININRETVKAKNSQLTVEEIEKIKTLREKVDAYIIWKSNSDIYYGLYGFLDTRLGVSYVIDDNGPRQFAKRHLIDNWYY